MDIPTFSQLFRKYSTEEDREKRNFGKYPKSKSESLSTDSSLSNKTDLTNSSGSTLTETLQKLDFSKFKSNYNTGKLLSAHRVELSLYEANRKAKKDQDSSKSKASSSKGFAQPFDKTSYEHFKAKYSQPDTKSFRSNISECFDIKPKNLNLSSKETTNLNVKKPDKDNQNEVKNKASISIKQESNKADLKPTVKEELKKETNTNKMTTNDRISQFIAKLKNHARVSSMNKVEPLPLISENLLKCDNKFVHQPLKPCASISTSEISKPKKHEIQMQDAPNLEIKKAKLDIDNRQEQRIVTNNFVGPEQSFFDWTISDFNLNAILNKPNESKSENLSHSTKREIKPKNIIVKKAVQPNQTNKQIDILKQTKISDFFPKVKQRDADALNQNLTKNVSLDNRQYLESCSSSDNSSFVKEDIVHSDENNCNEQSSVDDYERLSQEFSQIKVNPEGTFENVCQISPNDEMMEIENINVDSELVKADQKLKEILNKLKTNYDWTQVTEQPELVANDEDELVKILKNPYISKYFKRQLITNQLEIIDNDVSQSSKPESNQIDSPAQQEFMWNEQCNPSATVEPIEIDLSQEEDTFYDLPIRFRSLFQELGDFNELQKLIIKDLVTSNVSMAISAPTGCGKTVAFELAIAKLLIDEVHNKPSVVMISPLKAICKEKFKLWDAKFEMFNFKCLEITGDTEFEDIKSLVNFNIIITTPEKWDSLSRKYSFSNIVKNIKLLLIDEIHTISDEFRGPILESLVSRMKFFNQNSESKLRIITLSATIPNVVDVSNWISYDNNECKSFQIGEEKRPVKLQTIVQGFDCPSSSNDFFFDTLLNHKLYSVIEKYSKRRPTLIFASTRKITEKTALFLASRHNFVYSPEMKSTFNQVKELVRDNKLKETLNAGVAFHHAGLEYGDRERIQDAFTNGQIPVLISTSTLALGVNLPAHLVIIKGTFQYVNGVCQQYDENQILQMIGRAGRPQFDTEATAVIMTKNSLTSKFENFINNSKTVESQLHKCLAENLNTEVYLGLITNLESSLSWIKSTFLYVRIFQNPSYYGFGDKWTANRIADHLKFSLESELKILINHNLIEMDEQQKQIKSTSIGKIMAEYYISLGTIKCFFEIKKGMDLNGLLEMICSCNELIQETQIRNTDKEILNKLNLIDRKAKVFGLRFPIRKPVNTTEKKINCLIQSFLGCNSLHETPLLCEASKLMKTAGRVTKCLLEYLIQVPQGYKTVLNAIYLAKAITAGIWENSEYVAKQLPRVGITLSTKLVNSDFKTFDSILKAQSRDIELVLNKNPPFADNLKSHIADLPDYEVNVKQKSINSGMLKACIEVQVRLTKNKRSELFPFHSAVLLIGDEEDNLLLCHRLQDSTLLSTNQQASFELTVEKVKQGTIFVNLISERIVGIDKLITFDPMYQGQRKRLRPIDPDDMAYLQMQFGE